MRHAYLYNGAFEKNYAGLRPGATTYVSTEGEPRPLPAWPADIDGVRIGYMEKSGKKFYAVRVQHGGHDIVLENPVHIDPMSHMGNQRFSADATVVSDDDVSSLLDEIIRENPDRQPDLAMMINQINQTRRGGRPSAD